MSTRRTPLLILALLAAPFGIAAEEHEEALTNIVISADPRRPGLLENSAPASVMQKEEIKKRAETSLGETVQSQPGVSSTYFGPAASRPVIRGNSGERVRILRNGIGSFDISNTGEDHQVTVNPLTADSIEVLRGPETLLYGNSAIGGVVNILDSAVPEFQIGKPLSGELDVRSETVDQELSGAGKVEGQVGRFNWHISGMHQDTANVNIPSGVLENSFSRSASGTVGGSYIWENGFWGVSVTQYDSRYGIPGEHHHADEDEEEHESSPLIELEQLRVDSRGAIQNISDSIDQIKFRFGASQYEHSEIEGATAGTVFDNDSYEGRVEVFHNTLAGFKGIVGSQFEGSDFSATGEEAFVPGFKRYAPALFSFEEFRLASDLKWLFGVRYEYNYINAISEKGKSFHPASVSTGMSWDIDQLKRYVAGLNFAFTQRAPSGTELYADGIHAARQIFEVGNADLPLERSLGIDLTLKKNEGLITSSLNLFAQHYDNFINLSPTGGEQEGFDVYTYSPIEARFFGFELENTAHLHELVDLGEHHFDLGAQFDYVNAHNESDSDSLPRIPPFRSILKATYDWNEKLFASLETTLVAAQTDTARNETATGAYQLLSANVSYKLNDITLYARALNLTNEEAHVHSSFIKDLAPLPGRSFVAGITFEF